MSLKLYFMKCSERKVSQCILALKQKLKKFSTQWQANITMTQSLHSTKLECIAIKTTVLMMMLLSWWWGRTTWSKRTISWWWRRRQNYWFREAVYNCQKKAKKTKKTGKKHSRNLYFLQLLPHLIKSHLKKAVFNNEQQKVTEGKLMQHIN